MFEKKYPIKVKLVKEDTPISPVNAFIEKFSKVFNFALGASTILYVFGYFSWAYYAWEEHLGLLPA